MVVAHPGKCKSFDLYGEPEDPSRVPGTKYPPFGKTPTRRPKNPFSNPGIFRPIGKGKAPKHIMQR